MKILIPYWFLLPLRLKINQLIKAELSLTRVKLTAYKNRNECTEHIIVEN
jgi:hypothetical protein